MTTFTRRAREGAHLISEGNFNISRESGVATPAAAPAIGPGKLVMKAADGVSFKLWDRTSASTLEGVAFGYCGANGGFAYTARLAEVKAGYVDLGSTEAEILASVAALKARQIIVRR